MFGRGRKSASGWTAIDAGPDGILGVSLRAAEPRAKPVVLKCAHLEEPSLDAGSLAQIAKRLSSSFRWTLPLPRGDYKILVVQQPTVAPEELAQSVRWSLGPMLDFPVDEAVVDWMTIPTAEKLPNRPPHIYVIATHRDIVAQRTQPFLKAKLPLDAVDIRETAQRNIATLAQRGQEGVGMVALNKSGVQITFTYDGELYLDRYIEEPIDPLVTGDEDARERVFDRITLQLQRSIDFMNRTYPFITIARILVAPMPAPIPLRDYLAANVAEPVEMLDLASLFDFSETPELVEDENQARYFTALGSALRGAA